MTKRDSKAVRKLAKRKVEGKPVMERPRQGLDPVYGGAVVKRRRRAL